MQERKGTEAASCRLVEYILFICVRGESPSEVHVNSRFSRLSLHLNQSNRFELILLQEQST